MQINLLDPADTRHEIICDVYAITEIASFDELLQKYADFKSQYPNHSILLTLDDLGQAQYTSMHAKMSFDLDDVEGYDLSAVDKSAFENGEHLGYLTTKSEFFIRKENFEKQSAGITFTNACSRGLTLDDEIDLLEAVHHDPMLLFDKQVLMHLVPVQSQALSLCVFPNGYFTCDLTPFENYALATHLENNYGYQLLGIGASSIGFIRDRKMDRGTAGKLTSDLANLYQCEDQLTIDRLTKIVLGNNYLFLKYTESFDL